MISFVYLVSFLVSVQHVMAGNTNHYCYTGSSIYETEIQNCPSEDPSYTGTWYCGTMRVRISALYLLVLVTLKCICKY